MSASSETGFIRELPGAVDVFAIATALGDADGLALLTSDDRGARQAREAASHFLAVDPVDRVGGWLPPRGRPARGWAGRAAAPRWIGFIPYEAGRGLERPGWRRAVDGRAAPLFVEPEWLRYDAVLRVDRSSGRAVIEADDARSAARLAQRIERATGRATLAGDARGHGHGAAFRIRGLAFDDADAAHEARVAEVLDRIREGEIYQANVARRLSFRLAGEPLALYRRLFAAAPSPFGFFLRHAGRAICGSSPELALEVRDGVLRTAPIKGTRPRGVDAEDDRRFATELDADPKERAELTMAVDLHRNDLGRVARYGSVRVEGEPRILSGRTVHSRVASVRAHLAEGKSATDAVRSMIPCGSVTGAPKVRAMELLADLEPARRGLYTGAFGYVGRDEAVVLAMAIRTATVAPDGDGAYFAGGGIVAKSDPRRETEETRWKAAQLLALAE